MGRASERTPVLDQGGGAYRPIAPAVVERLRSGDVDAFGQVYAACHARLLGFLLRLTRDEALARDLAQETWLRLAANARRLAPDSEPGAWLFTVARNLFVSRSRWALLDRARRVELAFRQRERTVPSPLAAACTNELQRRLERALAALPRAEREVVLLICVEGFGAEAVARMLDASAAAVRKRLSRGRARLQQTLAEERLDSGDDR